MVSVVRVGPIASFDAVIERFRDEPLSFTEHDALGPTHWELGEDARLREDLRFRPTPWGRWILADRFLANEALYRQLQRGEAVALSVSASLASLEEAVGRQCVLCPADERLVLEGDSVRLAASQLSAEPLLEETASESRFSTHLPVYDLDVVAASMARGEWDQGGTQLPTESESGWLRVNLEGRRLNPRMFLARIRGDSMDDGQSGLVDGAYVVFEREPHGTRVGRSVLVYGQLTGAGRSWALKRYVRAERGEDNAPAWIRLVSLNPDNEQYPDIELRPEEDEDVQILAVVVQPLGANEYACRPRSSLAGRRNLASGHAHDKALRRMRKALVRFFSAPGEHPDGVGIADEFEPARFVCLDVASGGLHIETEPLREVPPLVKKLSVVSGGFRVDVLASNLRSRAWRFAVAPSVEDYVWSAGAVDELLVEELERLRLRGLAADVATVFRIDAAGVGQQLESMTLSPGQDYRLLVPPGLDVDEDIADSIEDQPGGWRLVELSMVAPVGIDLQRALARLGLQVGRTAPRVFWVEPWPSRYATSARGESYACFTVGSAPAVCIDGIRADLDGEVHLLVSGVSQATSVALPAGERWVCSLADLAAGNYVLDVLHEMTRFEPVRLPFCVEASAPPCIPCEVCVTVGGEEHRLCGEDVELDGDFTHLGEEPVLLVASPPLWTSYARWQSDRTVEIGQLRADGDGVLDTSILTSRARHLLERESLGDLVLDFAELGIVRLRHEARRVKNALRHELAQLAETRGRALGAAADQFQVLRGIWIDDILRRLGYSVRELPGAEVEPPRGTAAALLESRERGATGAVVQQPERALVLHDRCADLSSTDPGSVRFFAETLCERFGLRKAVLTDGVLWTCVRPGLKGRGYDLLELLAHRGEQEFEEFLTDMVSENQRCG